MILYNNFPYIYSYIIPHLIPSFTFSTYLSLLNQVQSYFTLPDFLSKSFHSFIHSLTLTTLTNHTHTKHLQNHFLNFLNYWNVVLLLGLCCMCILILLNLSAEFLISNVALSFSYYKHIRLHFMMYIKYVYCSVDWIAWQRVWIMNWQC